MPNLDLIFTHFLPEILLVLGLLVILVFDALDRGRDGLQGWMAITTLLLALNATFFLWASPGDGQAIFEANSVITGNEVRAGAFVSDGFTNFFRTMGLLTALLVCLSGMRFMRGRTPFKGEFYALVLSAVLAMNLMAGANDLIMIALSVEFLSISSYVLTAFLRNDTASTEAGLKYFLYGAITSAAMLFGMTYLYGVAGSTSLPVLAEVANDPDTVALYHLDEILLPALVLVIAGIGFKIALVPFHQWSPDAYEGAPTPVTAFLSVGPKAAGFAVLLRLLGTVFHEPAYTEGWIATLGVVAILTMVVGNIAALTQDNVKRMMAYSSIAQAGYMLVGLVSLGHAKMAGIDPMGSVLLFILAYVFTNLGAFAAIIAVEHATGSADLSAFAGLMKRSPFLAVALAVFFLSLIGIPPLSGFIGKFAVFGSAVVAGQIPLAIIGVLTGVISVGYYFRVLREVFFGEAEEGAGKVLPAPAVSFVVAMALFLTFLIGIAPGYFIDLANQSAAVVAPAMEMVAGH